MINRIIEFSANNKILVFALLAAACLWGAWSAFHLPLDALPDLGETQVIVLSRWDRSPDIIEDQVTYPILSAMTGAPKVRTVRGISDFGYSYVYVIFEEGTDIYWARSRTLEYLSGVTSRLPRTSRQKLGPMRRRSVGFSSTFSRTNPGSTVSANCVLIRIGISAITCERCRESPRSLRSADSHSNTRSMWIPTGCAPMESPSRAWPTPFAKATAKPERGCWNSAALNI